jgi:hypothetical protein
MSIQQHPPLGHPLHRTSQHVTLDICPLNRQLPRAHAMIHPHDILLDDRALVEIRGHEVRRRADDLHAPLVRLVVGLRALETREEGVVDVDDAAGHGGAERRREDLHVPREDDEVDGVGLTEGEDFGLLRGFRLRSDGEVVEGDIVGGCQGGEVRVIGDDERDVDVELGGGLPEEKVVETVADFRDHDHNAGFGRVGVERVGHREGGGDVVELLAQGLKVEGGGGFETFIGPEVHAHEKGARAGVAVLLRVHDVEVVLCEEAGHSVDDAGAVRAGERERIFIFGGHDVGVVEVCLLCVDLGDCSSLKIGSG